MKSKTDEHVNNSLLRKSQCGFCKGKSCIISVLGSVRVSINMWMEGIQET